MKLKAFKSVKAVTAAFALPFNKVAFDLYATNVSNIVMFSYVLTEVHPWKLRISCYNHHQIGSVHLSHCYHIFFRGCVSEILLHYILLLIAYLVRENRDFVFIIIVQFMMRANGRIRFELKIVFVYLYITSSHYHHCASLSEDIDLIKCLSDIVCRVCE